ncbi:hypothetical protein [Streptomyces sp. TE33382]
MVPRPGGGATSRRLGALYKYVGGSIKAWTRPAQANRTFATSMSSWGADRLRLRLLLGRERDGS